mmetsp:Transcript_8928/g.28367  ORF Transcript_8928/g.28367 Transcript_8928/m.28367 type:complete len:212 (+) Transcript_8928:75-710(+)
MAATYKPYLNCVRSTLKAALCLRNFPSQIVERHNKPEARPRVPPPGGRGDRPSTHDYPAGRGARLQGAPAEPDHDLPYRAGEVPHRGLRELGPRVLRHQAGRRDRAHPHAQVHALPDAALRAVRDHASEARGGLQHLVPHHAHAPREDVEGQARRLHHHLHGGHQQGDLGHAHRPQLARAHRRGGVPQGLRLLSAERRRRSRAVVIKHPSG